MIRIILILLILCVNGLASNYEDSLEDQKLEKIAHQIFKQVKCLVCSGQSINDSDSDMAKNLRILIRERLVAGFNQKQIEDLLLDDYGQQILLKPDNRNRLIWLIPTGFLIFSGLIVTLYIKFSSKKRY